MKLHFFDNSFDFAPRTLMGLFPYRNCISHHLCKRGILSFLVLGMAMAMLFSSDCWEDLLRDNDKPEKNQYTDSGRSIHATQIWMYVQKKKPPL